MVMKNTGKHCRDGLIISAPEKNLFNTIICLFGLLYCFIGVATASNIFMRSIERIASTTRVKKKSEGKLKNDALLASQGEEYENIYVWNPTVANLTLMALGSSAPEILLSIIEIVGNSFKSGELGPGTIVGSAAFNLLCITSICTLVIPSPRVSQIKEMVILTVISPNVVEIWEAAITLAFFFILIVVAYLADIKIWKKEKMEQKFDFEDEIAFDSAIESKKMNMEEIDKKMQQLAERKMAQHYMAGIS
ncbi:unnamed protein product [Dracunculus medinensis]|uniref:Na_Ca_ex domain-containing protein n=1 Tax=Dracunculus medinensis TaxID=318479 RepID=A0A0N4U8L1_DRAME|nr:unnamed protein product [Dracunculus medinensis]